MLAPQIEVVRVGPSLGERITRRRQTETRALRRFREELEADLGPEWGAIELPLGAVLADVCEFLGLDVQQQQAVLGEVLEAGYRLV